MRVYIELVLFNNFAVDMLLEVCTLTAFGERGGKLRCVFAALIGAVAGTAYAVVPTPWRIAIRVLLAPMMTVVFFKPKEGKLAHKLLELCMATAVFCAFTFLVGGATKGMSYLLGVDVNGYATLGLVAGALAILIICARAIARKRSHAGARVKKVFVCASGQRIGCNALLDSGNLLVDDLSGLPVVIISDSLFAKLGDCRREGFISVNSVSGCGTLPLIALDGVEVDGVRLRALGALGRISSAGYDVILQAGMF